MMRSINSRVRSVNGFAAGILLLAACAGARLSAAGVFEDFEGSSGDTLPAGWTLIDSGGTAPEPDAVYTNVTGSNGAGGSAGVAGRVSSQDFVSGGYNGNLPGGYIVHSTAVAATNPFGGSLDFAIRHEDINDDITMIVGDVGSGLTRVAADALCLKVLEDGATAPCVLTQGNGFPLYTSANAVDDDTWYRVTFVWDPSSGKTGDFRASVMTLSDATVIDLFRTTAFTFSPGTLQFGVGSVNDKGDFDNIRFVELETLIDEDFEALSGSTLPAGWALIDTGGGAPEPDASYANATGSDGNGGSSGVGGRVSSADYSTYTGLPGAYVVAPQLADPTQPFNGSFDVILANEGTAADDAIFIIGAIGSGLTHVAGDAIGIKLIEGGGTVGSLVVNGAGTTLVEGPNVVDETWYRLEFEWTPTDGSTGDLSIRVIDLNSWTRLDYFWRGFTFTPRGVQFGFGSLNDTATFDDIRIHGVTYTPPMGTMFSIF